MRSSRNSSARFPKTRWTIILEAQSAEDARPALAELCELYWPPLYAFLRRTGHSPEDAEDLTQDFLARYLAKRHWTEAGPEKGKLRSYLLTDLKYFLSDRRKHAAAEKRGGKVEIASFDHGAAEERQASAIADLNASPDQVFDRSWAMTLIENATRRAEEAVLEKFRQPFHEALKATLWGDQEKSYAEIASEYGVKEGTVKTAAYRLRRKYHEALKAEVHHTLAEGEDVQGELQYLLSVL